MEFKYITQTVPDWDLKMTGEIRGGGGGYRTALLGQEHTVKYCSVHVNTR